jgi:hypothetical protein
MATPSSGENMSSAVTACGRTSAFVFNNGPAAGVGVRAERSAVGAVVDDGEAAHDGELDSPMTIARPKASIRATLFAVQPSRRAPIVGPLVIDGCRIMRRVQAIERVPPAQF